MESLLAHLARKERMRLRVMRIDVEAQPDLVERLEGRVSAPKIEEMLARHLETVTA